MEGVLGGVHLHLKLCTFNIRHTNRSGGHTKTRRMDWGYMVFGNDVEDAAAVFDATICTHLLGRGPGALSSAGSGPLSNGGSGSGAGPLSGLAGALGRLGGLLHRAQSEPSEVPVVLAPLAARPVAAAAAGMQGASVSEPSTPMLGALQAARASFVGAAGGGPAGGASGPSILSGVGSISMGDGNGAGAAAGEKLPDEIRNAPGAHRGLHDSEHYRVPSFQTGMRPW